jgi:hypothetical protein
VLEGWILSLDYSLLILAYCANEKLLSIYIVKPNTHYHYVKVREDGVCVQAHTGTLIPAWNFSKE